MQLDARSAGQVGEDLLLAPLRFAGEREPEIVLVLATVVVRYAGQFADGGGDRLQPVRRNPGGDER